MANWYYYDNEGQKQGPYSGGQLKWLAKNGKVTPTTTVEPEGKKSVLAEKIKGLTFLGAAPSETIPSESTAETVLAEDLGEQDFEQLRGDFERLQEQELQKVQRIPPVAAPVLATPPIVAAPVADQTVQQSVPVPVAKSGRASLWITIAGVLILLLISGIGWAMIENDKRFRENKKFNEIVEKGFNKDVLSKLPMEMTRFDVKWAHKSADKVLGTFSVEMKTTEGLYESVDREDGLKKLGITNLYKSELTTAMGQFRNLPVSKQNNLRDAMPQDLPQFRFYEVAIPSGENVALTGSVELIEHSGNDWKIARFLVDPFSCGDKSFYEDTFTSASKLGEGEYRLDDPKVKEIVDTIIQNRKDFIDKVDLAVASSATAPVRPPTVPGNPPGPNPLPQNPLPAQPRRGGSVPYTEAINAGSFEYFDRFAWFASQPENRDKLFVGNFSYRPAAPNYNGANSSLTMRFNTQFTSDKADEILLPNDLNVIGKVVRDIENRSLELSVKGDVESIKKLAKSTEYEARVWFKHFRSSNIQSSNNGAFADVLRIEIVHKVEGGAGAGRR
jgi:hypothetical protein